MRTWIRVVFAGLLVTAPVQGQRRGVPESVSEGVDAARSVVDRGDFEAQAGRQVERARVERLARALNDRSRRILDNIERSHGNERYRRGERSVLRLLTDFTNATNMLASNADEARRVDVREVVRHILMLGDEISRLMDGADPSLRNAWRGVDSDLARLADEAGERYSGRDYSRRDSRDRDRDDSNRGDYGSGSMRWRGRVDGTDCIVLRGDRVSIRHITAQRIRQDSHDLTRPLPRRPVNVRLNVIHGRGRVYLSQQPSASNNYSAEVCIEDDKGGDDQYEFEIIW